MLTDTQIQELIERSKQIASKTPAVGYREESRHKRCELELQTVGYDNARFSVFVRQSMEFIENFSLGLRFRTGDKRLGEITLIRYNGPHGEKSRDADGHYAMPHIHRITSSELVSRKSQPQEKDREITGRYSTYEEALGVFFFDVGVTNYLDFFPDALQPRLFNEYR